MSCKCVTLIKALFAWEIINEAEGLVKAGQSDRESCYDTQVLSGTGAGWAKKNVPMKNLLSFINRQTAAIKGIRGNEIMVTASGWSEKEFRVKRTPKIKVFFILIYNCLVISD